MDTRKIQWDDKQDILQIVFQILSIASGNMAFPVAGITTRIVNRVYKLINAHLSASSLEEKAALQLKSAIEAAMKKTCDSMNTHTAREMLNYYKNSISATSSTTLDEQIEFAVRDAMSELDGLTGNDILEIYETFYKNLEYEISGTQYQQCFNLYITNQLKDTQRLVQENERLLNELTSNINPFVSFSDIREPKIKRYRLQRNSLYYDEDELQRHITCIFEKRRAVIKGRQGSGKTMRAFRIAEEILHENEVSQVFYLSQPDPALSVIMKLIKSNPDFTAKKYLWIIDDIHQEPLLEQRLMEVSLDNDYYIFVTRNLNKVNVDPYTASPPEVMRIEVRESIFRNCLSLQAGYENISEKNAKLLFNLCGGDLFLMNELISLNSDISSIENLTHEKIMDKAYQRYFVNPLTDRLSKQTLCVLFLLMMDLKVPNQLQNDSCKDVLSLLLDRSSDNVTVTIEHASLATLLFVCICFKQDRNIDYESVNAFKWAVERLNSDIPSKTTILFLNVLIRSVAGFAPALPNAFSETYKFLFTPLVIESILSFAPFISCDNWQILLNSEEGKSVYLSSFKQLACSDSLYKSMIHNNVYRFNFVHDILNTDSINKMEKHLFDAFDIINSELLVSSDSGDEVFLFDFLVSLSEIGSCSWIERMEKKQIIELLTRSTRHSFLFGKVLVSLPETSSIMLQRKLAYSDYHELMSYLTITSFARILCAVSAPEIKQTLFTAFKENCDYIINKTIESGVSIRTLGLSLREMKNESPETLQAFEQSIDVDGYLKLIEELGTLPVFAKILENSSDSMRNELAADINNRHGLVDILVKRTIESGASIRTLGLSLREMKNKSPDALQAFEQAIDVGGYLKLIEALGTLPVFAKILEHSSKSMRINLATAINTQHNLVDTLIKRTIESGASIRTLGLSLRDMKNESSEALQVFEQAIDVGGYLKLIEELGTLPDFARILQHSSESMRIKLATAINNRHDLVDTLVKRTIESGTSIGTLSFSLRIMKNESSETLQAFEQAIDVGGYLKLVKSLGNLPVFALILQYSSKSMSTKILSFINTRQDLVDTLVKRTIENGVSINSLYSSLRAMKKESSKILRSFEQAIGVERYMSLFSEGKITVIGILKILAYSSISVSLVNAFYDNLSIMECAHDKIEKVGCNYLEGFSEIMSHAHSPEHNMPFYELCDDTINCHRWLYYFRHGATIDEFIAIMQYIPIDRIVEIEQLIFEENNLPLNEMVEVQALRKKPGKSIPANVLYKANMRLKRFAPELYSVIKNMQM